MKDLFKPLAMASIAVLLTAVGGCNEERGDDGAANARVAAMQQQLARAQQDAEKALTRNTLLQSRLKVLEAEAASAVAAAEVVSETAVVEAVAGLPLAAADAEQAGLQAELATVSEERDRLHALLEENEEALRDGVAEAAQKQQLMTAMEEQLATTRQVAEAAVERLALAEEQIRVMQGERNSDQNSAKASVAQMAGLQEQLVAIQADKTALESRLSSQRQQLVVARSAAAQAEGKVATLEQLLAAARAHGNTLAEQLAAIQADTHKLEVRLVEAGNQLQAAQARAQTEAAKAVDAAEEDPATAIVALKGELVAALDEDARLRDRANVAGQRVRDMEEQLRGALAQARALQQEAAGLRQQRDELEAEMQGLEAASASAAVVVDSSALAVDDAVEIQALLEEGQALLEACNASLGSGAEQMFELEQQSQGMQNALERQRRVTATRCNRMSAALEGALTENRRMRAIIAGQLAR
jgi:chromosome segregation ATPase